MLSAEFRMSLDPMQMRGLIAAGFLSSEPECPGELRDAMRAVLATLPMPLSATQTHVPPAR
jgi:hypothetical protein